jgi:hypothetical protein
VRDASLTRGYLPWFVREPYSPQCDLFERSSAVIRDLLSTAAQSDSGFIKIIFGFQFIKFSGGRPGCC